MNDPSIDFPEFVRRVANMRRLQREFFRLRPEDRPPGLIRQARDAERAVDRAVAEIQQGQGTLFEGQDP